MDDKIGEAQLIKLWKEEQKLKLKALGKPKEEWQHIVLGINCITPFYHWINDQVDETQQIFCKRCHERVIKVGDTYIHKHPQNHEVLL